VGALVGNIGPGRPIGELASMLLTPTMGRDGKKLFSEELISDTLGDVLIARTPKTPKDSGTQEVQDFAAVPVHLHGTDEATHVILDVVRRLEKRTSMPVSDTLGQLLWQNRDVPSLREGAHRQLVEDLSWVVDPEHCSSDSGPSVLDLTMVVFRELTAEDSGRMKWRTWLKVVEYIKRNPLLTNRINRNDADRIFHAEAMREVRGGHSQDQGISVGSHGFMGLIMKTAEIIEMHPFVLFLAVGCHADYLVEERQRMERKAQEESAALMKTAGPGSRGPSPSPPVGATGARAPSPAPQSGRRTGGGSRGPSPAPKQGTQPRSSRRASPGPQPSETSASRTA